MAVLVSYEILTSADEAHDAQGAMDGLSTAAFDDALATAAAAADTAAFAAVETRTISAPGILDAEEASKAGRGAVLAAAAAAFSFAALLA